MKSKPESTTGDIRPETENLPKLSEKQQKALAAANSIGYFDVPRGGTLGDIAEELDISRASASELVRRALRNLVKAHIDTPAGD